MTDSMSADPTLDHNTTGTSPAATPSPQMTPEQGVPQTRIFRLILVIIPALIVSYVLSEISIGVMQGIRMNNNPYYRAAFEVCRDSYRCSTSEPLTAPHYLFMMLFIGFMMLVTKRFWRSK